MEAELRIAAVLSRRPFSGLTIHQLSKEVGKSYSFTYLAAQRMIKAGLLREQRVGHAVLCTLILKNPEVQALLTLNAARQKQTAEIESIVRELRRQLGVQIHHVTVLSIEHHPYILCDAHTALKGKLPDHRILKAEEKGQWIKTLDFSKLELHYNAAYFWAVVGDANE